MSAILSGHAFDDRAGLEFGSRVLRGLKRRWWYFGIGLVGYCVSGCGSNTASNPFLAPDAGSDSGDAGSDANDDAGQKFGAPCVDDAQCDDGAECSIEHCDLARGRCTTRLDHEVCQDAVYCNGRERCEQARGCVAGSPIACSDGVTCTIDRCIEETKSCEHSPRDADGDGDPNWNCGTGGDCNDADPLISSLLKEVCLNEKDDDCDGEIDESSCVTAAHDRCQQALVVSASGSYGLSLAAAQTDYGSSCLDDDVQVRDLVVALEVPEGPPRDIDVVVIGERGKLGLSTQAQCGDASSETACVPSYASQSGVPVSRLRLHQVETGVIPLLVFGNEEQDLLLKVEFLDASLAAENETCGTALPLEPEVPVVAPVFEAVQDLKSQCDGATGELVYSIELAEPSDVRVLAAALDSYGQPSLSLRGPGCTQLSDELTCRNHGATELFARSLAAGTYFLAVSASGPSSVDLRVLLEEPSAAPVDENCESPPNILSNQSSNVSFTDHVDDIDLGCVSGAVDAAFALELTQTSDVLVVQSLSSGDNGGIALAAPACHEEDRVVCAAGTDSPLRARSHAVPAGSYRVISESTQGNPTKVTPLVRPATAATWVPFADQCADAIQIPSRGGFFLGNTANASADYSAGCDYGFGAPEGAPEQMLRLSLSEPSRVVLDMQGSDYETLLSVRRAQGCPGTEVESACSAGFLSRRSYLDLTLEAGDYFIQVDGFAGARGNWQLDAFIVPL